MRAPVTHALVRHFDPHTFSYAVPHGRGETFGAYVLRHHRGSDARVDAAWVEYERDVGDFQKSAAREEIRRAWAYALKHSGAVMAVTLRQAHPTHVVRTIIDDAALLGWDVACDGTHGTKSRMTIVFSGRAR